MFESPGATIGDTVNNLRWKRDDTVQWQSRISSRDSTEAPQNKGLDGYEKSNYSLESEVISEYSGNGSPS